MSRRNFLKQMSILAVASACAFKGGMFFNSKKENEDVVENVKEYKFDAFSGCKNSGFKFSAPLPFDFKLIDEIVEINKKYKKSKLVTLYGALPDNVNPLLGFVSQRGEHPDIKNFNDFTKYVKYAYSKGFDFVYLLNSPKPFTKSEFKRYEGEFNKLLSDLKSIGCYKIKVANQQMLEIFKNIPEFEIQASTAFEYTNLRQLENFLQIYPRVKHFNLAIDTNRNIPLLKNLKKIYKDINFEIMTDENCMYGCPARIPHISCKDYSFPCYLITTDPNCWKMVCRCNIIYPWNLDYYASLPNGGIKNFKLMGIQYGVRPYTYSVDFIRNYFESVENGIGNISSIDFLRMFGFKLSFAKETLPITKEIIDNLPDINYFIKNGDKCAANCGGNCNYCIECAEKLEKIERLYTIRT